MISTSNEDHLNEGSRREAATTKLSSLTKAAMPTVWVESRGPVASKSAPNKTDEESLRAPPLGHWALETMRCKLLSTRRGIEKACEEGA